MASERAKYTEEYRVEAADYAISTGRPVIEVAREIGVEPKTLGNWVGSRRRELADPGAEAAARAGDAELKAARRRIRELEAENEFLNKASAYFARGQGL